MELSVRSFVELGYLQEVNRRLLHPLGLCLEVGIDDEGTMHLTGVADCRGEPGGAIFEQPLDSRHEAMRARKAAYIDEQWALREPGRQAELGYMVQPAGG